jgi:UDP-N-acetylmuramyl pentapeptide phosphotransferase/UDP-N-acetylglucosamine-1-phosphate transferase
MGSGVITASASGFGILAVLFLAAAGISYGLLRLLRPLLQRHALAHPNARSSHKIPTPQGGGVGVVAATVAVVSAASLILPALAGSGQQPLWLVLSAAVLVAIVGAVDDVYAIPVLPRLALQVVAIAIVLASVPGDLHIVAAVPFGLERVLIAIAMLWFVNLVNFMDGIDWITVAEIVPVIGALGALSPAETVVAITLCGAVAGFAPLNKPVAKLFLGDVGSLAIGLVTGWLLVMLALRGHIAAAVLLPLYYLTDATFTLLRRLLAGEPIWKAHRTHFYQRALDLGFDVRGVVARVLAANLCLVALAALTIRSASPAAQIAALVLGAATVGVLLYLLSRPQRPQ